ncbi:MAG TPA: DedA family protein/thiosulfate sulfurtransferase GlpE [Candidatus Sulfotelmatobacter sp.]|jgi:membrane protein DedA with SNARE-associated domain/rhodanese-related sulfurtransferase|nr:DedA family protein/thiosulfate sulfurtransferase GlpE [Candidatus Sulfotelmatobacter sp.]
MGETLQFVLRHGYMLVFGWVFAEQAGLPVPSAPLLLAVGALAGTHRMNLWEAIAFAVVGSMASDSMWYEIGRLRGIRVLQLLCRISLEPDSCVRKTQVSFSRSGPRVLLGAKFIPGLNAMAAPLAGIIRMGWRKFLLFDAAGAIAWVGAYTVTGYVFSGELERVAARAAFLGEWLLVIVLAAFAGYIFWKFYNRQRFLRKLKIARITPEELKEKIDSGEDVLIVDLRHALEFDANPETIPGALHVDAAELEEASDVIPRDREIVLFCACPNEVTAARLALLLRSKGITRIRPLSGGYEGWRSRGFPLSLARDESGNIEATKA